MALFSFIADDLTGASDVLAQAHRCGLDAVLVVGDAPLPGDADVVGIAGPSRSLGGAEFDDRVRADLRRIAEVPSEVLLYKICSTFDSSPTMGSIGRGIELLHERFPQHGPIAVAPAQPEFGRFTAFSTHFAVHDGATHRLDRHPVMAQHPSTPMDEADLREVLGAQWSHEAPAGSVQLPVHAAGEFPESWRRQRSGSAPAFVVDAVQDGHLDLVARALLGDAAAGEPALIVGSGGMMAALARARGTADRAPGSPSQASGPVLAVSASASEVTAHQLRDAADHGWVDIPLSPDLLQDAEPSQLAGVVDAVSTALADGDHVMVHTVRGSDDPRYGRTGNVAPSRVGALLGAIVTEAVAAGLTQDVAIFGGDTSSHALAALGVRELRVREQFVTAAPICRSDDDAVVAGCRIVLKGGQVGPPDLLRRFAGDGEASTAQKTLPLDERQNDASRDQD